MALSFRTNILLANGEIDFIDMQGFFSKHSLSAYNLLDCAGGMGDDNTTYFKCKIETITPDIATVNVSSAIHECDRTINLKSRFITNEFFKVNISGQGFGRQVFNRQLIAARKFGIPKITLQATGGDISDWNGHYTWGRFGFSMTLDSDRQKFKAFCKDNYRSESSLFELLSTRKGQELWKNEGFSWAGEFDTNEKSPCSRDFQLYLNSKI